MRHSNLLKNLFFIIVLAPILIYWVDFTFITPGPFYEGYDPETIYLMDSLSVFNGHAYGYTDHPGTPVSIIGTILLAFTYPFIHNSDFTLYHLFHPELFLSLTHTFLLLATIGGAYYLYKTSCNLLSKRTMIASLMMPLAFFALNSDGYNTTTFWSHNSFNFFFGTGILTIWVSMLKDGNLLGHKNLLFLGIALGVLSTVQLYFLVWPICAIVTIFIFYRLKRTDYVGSFKASLLLGLGSLIGFLVSILPILGELSRVKEWFTRLIFHQGVYGSGEAGIISWQTATTNFTQMVSSQRELFIAVVVLFAIFVTLVVTERELGRAHSGLTAMGTGLIFQVIILTILIIKHPGQIYLLSIAATLPLLLLIDLKLLEGWVDNKNSTNRNTAYLLLLIGLLLFIGARSIINLKDAIYRHHDNVATMNTIDVATQRFLSEYAKNAGRDRQDLVVLYTYGTYNRCYALLFGKNYINLPIKKKIGEVCPNSYELNIWSRKVWAGFRDSQRALDEIKWDFIIMKKTILYERFNFLFENEIVAQISPEYPEFVIIQNHLKK
ncbi:MAG: hypothetical protein MUO77_06890 [Anaerolineales bacterium]|nr:hypothetical protein [Anaerolineales bacterium]